MSALSPIVDAEFFQLGYVTSDLQKAMELWKTRYGVTDFFSFDTRDLYPADHPGPFIKVALGYQGSVEVELIEPDPERPGIYGHALTPGGGTRLHHLGYYVDGDTDLNEMKARFEALGSPVPRLMIGGPDLLYADTRAENGLFVELVARTEHMLNFFKKIPRPA